MIIKGLKKAVGDYNRANAGGKYDPFYGLLMFNKETGEIWTDEFCSGGHDSYRNYADENIVNLGRMMKEVEMPVSMANVKKFLETVDI